MVNLNRLGSGRKLIHDTVKTSKRKNTIWSRANQVEKISKQKNPHTTKSRPKWSLSGPVLDRTLINHVTTGRYKFDISIEKWMDGGGLHFGLEYPDIIKKLFPNKVFNNCLDWCSGPGTIGFELLSHGLIKNLTLMDINGEVIRAAKNIIQKNDMPNVSTVVTSSCKFLNAKAKYDLVVSNPPHFNELKHMSLYNGSVVTVTPDARRKAQDKDWKIHEDFFLNIQDKITDDAIIILQENTHGSCIDDFKNMIDSNGFVVLHHFTHKIPLIYYIVIGNKNDYL